MCIWTKKRGSMNAEVLMATPCPKSLHGKGKKWIARNILRGLMVYCPQPDSVLVNFFFASCQSGLPFKLPVHSPRCWRLGAAVGVRARGFGTITFEWLNLYG